MIKELNNLQQTLDKRISENLGFNRINLEKIPLSLIKSGLILIGHISLFLTWWVLIAMNDYLFWKESLICSAIIFSLLFFRSVEQKNPFGSNN